MNCGAATWIAWEWIQFVWVMEALLFAMGFFIGLFADCERARDNPRKNALEGGIIVAFSWVILLYCAIKKLWRKE